MKSVVISLVLALGLGTAVACDKFTILAYPFDVYEDTSLSAAQLNERFRESGKPVMVSFIRAKGGVASDPRRCTLTVGYENPTLYVASEVNDSECMKKRVFTRERERLKIYERFVDTLPKRVSVATKRFKDDLVGGPKPDLLAILFDELAAVELAIEAHDSAFSYSSMPFACDGAMIRFLPR